MLVTEAAAAAVVSALSRKQRKPWPVFPVTDIVSGTFDFMPATLAGYFAGICITVMLYWGEAPPSLMLPWLAVFALVWLARAWMAVHFQRRTPQEPHQWQRWRVRCNIGTLAGGVMWGVAGWLFYPIGERIQEIGLLIVIYSFCVAGVPVLATQPRVYLTFATLCFMPLATRIAMEGRAYGHELIGILFVIITLTGGLTQRYRQAMERVLELKLRTDELVSELRVEKQAADAARREAEVANRAKTQFFAAASHDLRQPLHAMSLFAEALRQKKHRDDEVAALVNSINASVDALEELFSQLLDITRIDSGGVAVEPQHIAVGDIFRKLKLHFEPNAFEKGLALRFRGGQHLVWADPLLVERVLRNLLSNAIRYTNDGSVLVSCRRRGPHVLLQVWDTGVGIREQERSRIFEEFYQVPDIETAAHQHKGLGLGLAIVKRLAHLMQAPLSLRSTPGRGTVFTLELPPGKAVPAYAAAVAGKAPLRLTLDGRLIVVVEDEPAVRSALEALLRAWGASIVSFDSVAACEAWAQRTDAESDLPDLLIVDYRLEKGRSGVEAIAVLRQRFGEQLPAIMVTGSTTSGHEQEAQENNFHLLIKPVVPNKLRAMIAFKLAVKGTG